MTAVRTGCGKSQVGHYCIDILRKHKLKTVLVRHPMPYGVYLLLNTWRQFFMKVLLLDLSGYSGSRGVYQTWTGRKAALSKG